MLATRTKYNQTPYLNSYPVNPNLQPKAPAFKSATPAENDFFQQKSEKILLPKDSTLTEDSVNEQRIKNAKQLLDAMQTAAK